jgi:hypothetical protein
MTEPSSGLSIFGLFFHPSESICFQVMHKICLISVFKSQNKPATVCMKTTTNPRAKRLSSFNFLMRLRKSYYTKLNCQNIFKTLLKTQTSLLTKLKQRKITLGQSRALRILSKRIRTSTSSNKQPHIRCLLCLCALILMTVC